MERKFSWNSARKLCFVLALLSALYSVFLFVRIPSDVARIKAIRQRSQEQSRAMPINPERAKKNPELVEFVEWADGSLKFSAQNAPLVLTILALAPLLLSAGLFALGLVCGKFDLRSESVR